MGFRHVQGLTYLPAGRKLPRLPPDASSSEIIERISLQFDIPRDRVLNLARRAAQAVAVAGAGNQAANKPGLDETSPASEWLAVYDRLQKANRERFKSLDHKKYEGGVISEAWGHARAATLGRLPGALGRWFGKKPEEAGYRRLANRTYPPGWKGALLRFVELHKHLIGFFVRFPYHLFDMFLFGYFRQGLVYEFRHSHEDFLNLAKPGTAERYLAAALETQVEKGSGRLGVHLAKKPGRWLAAGYAAAARKLSRNPAGPDPVRLRKTMTRLDAAGAFAALTLEALLTFLKRRLVMAVLGAVAMGLLGALAPSLVVTVGGVSISLLSIKLASIPLLGPVLVFALNGLPVVVGGIPFFGDFLAPVVAAATGALLKDMILGPLLNTWILSSMLTLTSYWPQAAAERRMKILDENPKAKVSRWQAYSGSARSWAFWGGFFKHTLKSFVGMVTVGAEIEGIMTYADKLDAGVAKVSGQDLKVFHAMGAAVERPPEWVDEDGHTHKNLIPFGGAITWGNSLLYKLQDWTGFRISDGVLHTFRPSLKDKPAEQVFAEATRQFDKPGEDNFLFDPDLYKKTPAQVEARLKELMAKAGRLPKEIAEVKEQMRLGSDDLERLLRQLEDLKKERDPLSPAELAEYEKLLGELGGRRAEGYAQDKLAQGHDLKNPADEKTEKLKALMGLLDHYQGVLPEESKEKPGFWDDLAIEEASLKALAERLTARVEDRAVRRAEGEAAKLDEETVARLERLVTAIEELRGGASGEMASRDAIRQLLMVANKSRNLALRDRRDGKEMLEFHKNLSRLATVMDLALSLNEIQAAQKAIKDMLDLVDQKLAKVKAAYDKNQQDRAQAEAKKGEIESWRELVRRDIADNKSTQDRMVKDEGRASLAVNRFGAFERDMSALIAQLDVEYGGAGGDALRELDARIALLSVVAEFRETGRWNTTLRPPPDPDSFTLKKFQDYLTEVEDGIANAEKALDPNIKDSLPQAPVEFAGATIILIPGPKVTYIPHPDPAQRVRQVLNILDDREAHWKLRQADFKESLEELKGKLNGTAAGSTVDEFGDPAPKSLPAWRAREAGKLQEAEGRARQYAAQIDELAAQIESVSGAPLPRLSNLSLEKFREEVKTYGDKIRAVSIPDTDSAEGHKASMNLISLAKLVPYTAREVIVWARADATIEAIDEASADTLPKAIAVLEGIVAMADEILADLAQDRVFVTQGGDNQALLDRKIALLQGNILPRLREAKTLLTVTLIPFQREAIDNARPNTGKYFELFDAQKTLVTEARKLYDKTVPWGLASFGAREGDKNDAHAKIENWRYNIQKNIDGYDDAEGHHKGLKEFQQEVANRKNKDFAGPETEAHLKDSQYPDGGPYSLPRKIALYTEERTRRAAEINGQAVQINEILGKMQAIIDASERFRGRYDLRQFSLPTNVTPDEAGVDRVQRIVDDRVIPRLGDALTAIGDEAQANSEAISIGEGGDGGPPSGTQPPLEISELSRLGILAKDAAVRLTPASLENPQSAPAAFAVARFLYADGVIDGAEEALAPGGQISVAESFLARGEAALSAAAASTAHDLRYVDSDQTSESPRQVYARKIATFASLQQFLQEAVAFFGLKGQWDQEKFATIDRVQTYYDSLYDIYDGGLSAGDGELTVLGKIKDSLQNTFDDLEKKRQKVSGWMAQLNDPHESALRRVNNSISELQDKTRGVLEANIKWHELQAQLKRSEEILKSDMIGLEEKQEALRAMLADPALQDSLPPDLVRRIEGLRLGRGMWAMGSSDSGSETIVLRKSQLPAFLETVLGMFSYDNAARDLALLKADILKNPESLASLIPDAQVIDFGDQADGFYMVYRSRFAVPHGLETGSWVTLGNVAKVWGSNVSVTGYQFGSPPSEGNAPYGDKGVEVTIESLQGENWVNYLTVDFHRFAFDIPPDSSAGSQARQSRLLVFDDFAMMLFGDRLYVGLAGFADVALDNPLEKPSYYGGNFKSSLKLTEVMRLNVEQQELFAKDPRRFIQDVNLDFTGYDPDLNKTFRIEAEGEDKRFSRTQVGPSFNVARLLQNIGAEESSDAFTVDLFFSRVAGTDDIEQNAIGASILKGFTIKDDSGKPWMIINNRATGELGQEYNTLTDRLSVTLPDWGVVVSGEGKLLGNARAYYAEISKRIGDSTTWNLGYGSRYVGMNNRLSLTVNTSFTLGEIWQAVTDNARENLKGGETLRAFNLALDEFFAEPPDGKPSRNMAELKRVFEVDVARKLLSQDMGLLTREIQDLRKAGAIMDNTRIRGMVGFVSSPVSEDRAERAVGGGFVVGTHTEVALSKTQKALIEAKAQSLYREGLRLQTRFLELTKEWQGAVVAMAQAQWELKMANHLVENSPSSAVRWENEVRAEEAKARLHQALLRYNILAGKNPTDPMPFDNLNPADLSALMGEIQKTVSAPDRLLEILHSLDEGALTAQLGEDPFNIMDWIPFVERLTLGIGVQLPDLSANQALGVGGSLRLPIWDPGNKDGVYVLEKEAVIQEMEEAYAEQRLKAEQEILQARYSKMSADHLRAGVPAAAKDLTMAVRAYRNGLIGPAQLREAFATWNWYSSAVLDAESRATLALAWHAVDKSFVHPLGVEVEPVTVSSLGDAFTLVSQRSHGLKEVALRQQAAHEMAKAADNRIQKVFLDIHVGANLTATGVGWLPSVGVTGIPITPILGFEFKPEELRELQVAQHEGQSEYYRHLKAKLEGALALQFYQGLASWKTASAALGELDGQVLPALEKAAQEAREREVPGGPDTDLVLAQKRFDEAKTRREQARLVLKHSEAVLNYLLGRSPDSPLKIEVDLDKAFAELQEILKAKDPVGTQRALLQERVKVARSVETMVDKDLKVEQLSLEPVSLVARSLGRLIDALAGEGIGNPDLVAAARLQTLTEERAERSFGESLKVQVARAQTELSRVRSELARLKDKEDPESRLQRTLLLGRELALRSGLLAMGADPEQAAESRPQEAPGSLAELKARLVRGRQALAAKPPDGPVEIIGPENMTHNAAGFLRYYFAKQTLSKEDIGKWFVEGWVEARLRFHDTPPETLLALAKLRSEKGERLYKNELASASASAEALSAEFEMGVRLLRWAEAKIREPGSGPGWTEFRARVLERLKADKSEIAALLDLAPDFPLESLMALVPEDPHGSGDLMAAADRFLKEVRERGIARMRAVLFDGGLPELFGKEDSLMNQIRADTIAQRMSYKGFTPVAAFGMFRERGIGSIFLEAPDPRAIQRGLENVLSEAIRKDLEAKGLMKELALRLHSLMSQVEDGAQEIEKRRKSIEAAERDYRAQLGRPQDPEQALETEAARERLAAAWLGFSEALIETKSAFIALVTELEALGQARTTALRPLLPPPSDFEPVRRDPQEELLSYWADRFLDRDFDKAHSSALESLGSALPPELRAKIGERAILLRIAKRNSDAVLHKDFTQAEIIDLLTRNDYEGKRRALMDALLELKRTPQAWEELSKFLGADLRERARAKGLSRAQYLEAGKELRDAFWKRAQASYEMRGAVERLETLRGDMAAAQQSLLESYLLDLSEDPSRFLLKDLMLDRFLKAQAAFDAELLKALESPELRGNKDLAWWFNALFDVRESLGRQIDGARAGRGMLALDALIMPEEGRLRAARWNSRPPAEIDRIAEALANLRATKERWQKGAASLQPLFAVTEVSQDGKRLWTLKGWLTLEEFRQKLAQGLVLESSGRYYLKPSQGQEARLELVGGVDVLESLKGEAAEKARANQEGLDLHERMKGHDFVLEKLLGERAGYSFEEIFGPRGRHAKGRVFFFEAPKAGDPPKKLHQALHPMAALAMNPDKYVLFVYEGKEGFSRGRFPTLESLRDSAEAPDFYRLALSAKGAEVLIEESLEARRVSLRQGFVEVKLNGYGLARDEKGRVAELYQTEDDFSAVQKAFKNAVSDLESAREDLAKARRAEAEAADEAKRAKAAMERESLEYQKVELRVRAVLAQGLAREMPQKPGESEQLYRARFKLELDKGVARDEAFKDAQERLEPFAEDFNAASQKEREARARGVIVAQQEAEAKTILERSKTWSLYRTDDLELDLDRDGSVVRVRARPVYGSLGLDEALGSGAAALTLRGPLHAAILDRRARIRHFYQDEEALEAAAKGWAIHSESLRGSEVTRDDGRRIRPVYRLSHYADPAITDEEGRPLPVLLSRRALIERVKGAESGLTRTKYWGVMPWRWGSLLLEIPRGVVGTPIEILFGRDPRQHHYLGRAYMYKTEGGTTEDYGFFRAVLGAIDILNLLPDPVGRFYDPSQFPAWVVAAEPVLPGEHLFQKDVRDPDAEKIIHYGAQSIQRSLLHSIEDLTAARSRTLSRFHGGSEEILIQELRGRSGVYEESSRRGGFGDEDLQKGLSDPLVAQVPGSDGSDVVVLSAEPGNLMVDRVERRVRIRPGAEHYARRAEAVRGYAGVLEEELKELQKKDPELRKALEAAEGLLGRALLERPELRGEIERIWNRWHALAWRLGGQRILERDIAKAEAEAGALRNAIAWWGGYLRKLEELARGPEPVPLPLPNPASSGPWAVFILGILALGALLREWLRRRRAVPQAVY